MTPLRKIEQRRQGLTIVELLVVVTIIGILATILVPRIRVINRDRAIREAARVVGSTIAKAVSRATLDDGDFAGIAIERNANIGEEVVISGTSYIIPFAGTRMFVLRSVPNYAGDDFNSRTSSITTLSATQMAITIAQPIEQVDANGPVIQPGDRVSLNYGTAKYPIESVSLAGGDLTMVVNFGLGNNLPAVNSTSGRVPFLVHRRPKKLESSKVDLPDGFMIDLRLSGPELPAAFVSTGSNGSAVTNPSSATRISRTFSVFGQATALAGNSNPTTDDIEILFNKDGGVDTVRFAFIHDDGTQRVHTMVPLDMMHFFVTEFQPTSYFQPDGIDSSLYDADAMWVSVDFRTGSTNIAYNTPPVGDISGAGFGVGLNASRALATGRQSAAQ